MRSDWFMDYGVWIALLATLGIFLFMLVWATVNGKLPQQAGKCLESHQIVHQDKIVDICDKWVME